MFVGLNFINGSFCWHRPDIQRNLGIFPLSNLKEINEAVDSSKKLIANESISYLDRYYLLMGTIYFLEDHRQEIAENLSNELAVNFDYVDEQLKVSLQQSKSIVSRNLNKSAQITGLVTCLKHGIEPLITGLFRGLTSGCVIWFPTDDNCITSQVIVNLLQDSPLARFPGILQLLHGDRHMIQNVLFRQDIEAFIVNL